MSDVFTEKLGDKNSSSSEANEDGNECKAVVGIAISDVPIMRLVSRGGNILSEFHEVSSKRDIIRCDRESGSEATKSETIFLNGALVLMPRVLIHCSLRNESLIESEFSNGKTRDI